MRARRITIVEVDEPGSGVEEEITWLSRCLGVDPQGDRLAFQIFLHLLEASRKGEGVRTIDITRSSDVSQAAVVYHMHSFLDSGLVVRKGRAYFLRGGSLEKAVEEMELDMARRMKKLKEMAARIDEALGR